MSTLIANFCLDNDESIIIRHDVNQRYIGIKIPSRSGYVWIKNAEFEALREGLWLMEERVRKHEKVTGLVATDPDAKNSLSNPPNNQP